LQLQVKQMRQKGLMVPWATWIALQYFPIKSCLLHFILLFLLRALITHQPSQMTYYYYIDKRRISRHLMEDYWNWCFLRCGFILRSNPQELFTCLFLGACGCVKSSVYICRVYFISTMYSLELLDWFDN
jgi:hypothetical protein